MIADGKVELPVTQIDEPLRFFTVSIDELQILDDVRLLNPSERAFVQEQLAKMVRGRARVRRTREREAGNKLQPLTSGNKRGRNNG
jgi:hypothetical protein